MKLGWASIFLMILFILPIIFAQEDFFSLRKTPEEITSVSTIDKNSNKIEDALEEKISKGVPPEVSVIISLKNSYNENDIQILQNLQGKIKHTYEYVINGFSADIPSGNIVALANQLGDRLEIVEEDKPVTLHSDKSVRIVRARNISWSTYNFTGNSSASIAVIDTGMDDTHPDLFGFQNLTWNSTAKIIGWKDTTADNTVTPVDFNGHGSHVASTSLGTGTSYGNGTITNTTTTFTSKLPNAGFCFVDKFEVQNPGTIKLNGTVSSGNFVMQLRNTTGNLIASDSTSPWLITHTTSLTGMWQAWGCNPGGSPGRPFSIIETYPYNAVGDGNNLFTGVAPNYRLTGIKIFQGGSGSTPTSELIEGMDWIVANKLAYRIKVATMSVGSSATSTTLRNAANNVVANGIPFTLSAGNDFPSATIGDPALAEKAITVGATNDDDQMTDYSSNGPTGSGKPDIVAPGGSFKVKTQITAADTNDDDGETTTFADYNKNDYTNLLGTSMATPHAAGAAALIIQAMENQSEAWSYTESQALKVKMILLMTAMETNNTGECSGSNCNTPTLDRGGKDLREGFGRINVDAAIESVIFNHTIGTSEQATLNKTPTFKNVWARKVSLQSGTTYEFNLTVPSGADFDLYLYNTTGDSIGNPVISNKSVSAIVGGNESITFAPSFTETYYLVVKAVSGSGQFNLASAAKVVKIISITLFGFPVQFGSLDPGAIDFPAPGNDLNQYIIRVDPQTNVNVDLFQKGDDFNSTAGILGIGNMTWSLTNNVTASKSVNKTFELIKSNVTASTNTTIYYWIDIPTGQKAAIYSATIFIDADETT